MYLSIAPVPPSPRSLVPMSTVPPSTPAIFMKLRVPDCLVPRRGGVSPEAGYHPLCVTLMTALTRRKAGIFERRSIRQQLAPLASSGRLLANRGPWATYAAGLVGLVGTCTRMRGSSRSSTTSPRVADTQRRVHVARQPHQGRLPALAHHQRQRAPLSRLRARCGRRKESPGIVVRRMRRVRRTRRAWRV